MIKLNPAFHIITTIAVIAAIAEKKKAIPAISSDHMKPLSSDRSDNNRWRSLSLRSLESGFYMIAELFFFSDRSDHSDRS